ncbi:MAG: MFS transporter [Planctomycetota bacterium]|nr:MFS transporter [Planctomycetota bacterium]
MFQVWSMALSVFCFGAVNGLVCVAIPQDCLDKHIGSGDLGLIAAFLPLGYALGCFFLGRLLSGATGKHVVAGGLLLALGAIGTMPFCQAAPGYIACQFAYGIASGAFWPFTSAWMLDFQTPAIGKTKILRFYNVGWTSGTASGSYIGGVICRAFSPTTVFYTALGVVAVNLAVVLTITATRAALANAGAEEGRDTARKVSFGVLFAAVLANLCVLATRTIVIFNFPELNKYFDGSPERQGLLVAGGLAGQLTAFLIGHLYEPFLGMRRMYVALGVCLVAINLAFSLTTADWILFPAVILMGFTAAVAFQKGILAATMHFKTVRLGTSVHEMVIGLGGLAPILGGALIVAARARGAEELTALRTPFMAMVALSLLALAVQVVLVTRRMHERALLPEPAAADR